MCFVWFSEQTATIFPFQHYVISLCKTIYSAVGDACLNIPIIHINLSLNSLTWCQFPEHVNLQQTESFKYRPLCYEDIWRERKSKGHLREQMKLYNLLSRHN